MNALTHAAAAVDAVTAAMQPKRQPVYVSQPDDWLEMEDGVRVLGYVGPQTTTVYYDVDVDERRKWFAVLRYVTLEVKGHKLRFYPDELTDEEIGVIDDLLYDVMREYRR